MLQVLVLRRFSNLVIDAAAHDVKQLAGDSLLAALIVLEV